MHISKNKLNQLYIMMYHREEEGKREINKSVDDVLYIYIYTSNSLELKT